MTSRAPRLPRYARFLRSLALGSAVLVGCGEDGVGDLEFDEDGGVTLDAPGSDGPGFQLADVPDLGPADVPDNGVADVRDLGSPDIRDTGPISFDGPLAPPDLPLIVG